MTTHDAWNAAALPASIEAGGGRFSVQAQVQPHAVVLSVFPEPGAGPVVVSSELLARLELLAPGDTRVSTDARGVVATRSFVEPDPSVVRDGAFALATVVATALHVARVGVESDTLVAAAESAAPPTFTTPAAELHILGSYRRVDRTQPAWAEPDGAVEPTAQLQPGELLHLIETRGDWACVRAGDGWPVWTDGRTLVPVTQPGAPPPPPPNQTNFPKDGAS